MYSYRGIYNRGYVLDQEELRGFINQLVSEWNKQRETKPLYDVKKWIKETINELLDSSPDVDIFFIYDGYDWVEIEDGEDFLYFLERTGNINDFIETEEET